jgi:hypothetical protein
MQFKFITLKQVIFFQLQFQAQKNGISKTFFQIIMFNFAKLKGKSDGNLKSSEKWGKMGKNINILKTLSLLSKPYGSLFAA